MEFHKDHISTRSLTMVAIILVSLCICTSHCLDTTEELPGNELAIKENQNSLSLSSVAWNFWSWLTSDLDDGETDDSSVTESRTFGKIRRLQMALIPIVFKFGIMSAMITVLVFLALKTVFLLKALLFLNAGTLLAKLFTLKSQYIAPQPMIGYHSSGGWSPPEHGGWSTVPQQPPSKEIHLHIHNSGAASQQYGWQNRADPYGAHTQLLDADPSLDTPAPAQGPAPATVPNAANRKAVYGYAYYRPS